MECIESSCQGGLNCCVKIQAYPGFYCKVVSQCQEQPLWQVIAIPSLLAFLTFALALIVCAKLRGQKKDKRDVTTYAYQQIRVKPKPKIVNFQHRTLTTVPVMLSNQDIKTKQKITQATPNQKITISQISSPPGSKL